MNTLEAIKTRRSTRRFSDNYVELEKLDKIVSAGRFASSGGNSQTCHFYNFPFAFFSQLFFIQPAVRMLFKFSMKMIERNKNIGEKLPA